MAIKERSVGLLAGLQRPGRGIRAAAAVLAGLALLPALTTSVAFQDMTSLIEGERAQARWQAFFVPSPAGSIEKAGLGFAAKGDRQLPAGSGLAAGDGALYTMDAPARVFGAPDEARVNRRDKVGRVLSIAPITPPKAFSAGSILERQSLLAPPASDKTARLGFSRRDAAPQAEIAVAMNFAPARGSAVRDPVPDAVMMASLSPRRAPSGEAAPAGPTALGYAAEGPKRNALSSLFGRVLGNAPSEPFVPPIGEGDHAWAATPLPATAYSDKEQACLAEAIYFESRGESAGGQAAVAQVILNRVRNPTYPKSICGVVFQNKTWRNRCQFSFACDGHKRRIANKRAYSQALRIADEVTRGELWNPEVGSATHYHATYVKPRWAKAMEKVDKIGQHIFYRTFNGGWN